MELTIKEIDKIFQKIANRYKSKVVEAQKKYLLIDFANDLMDDIRIQEANKKKRKGKTEEDKITSDKIKINKGLKKNNPLRDL